MLQLRKELDETLLKLEGSKQTANSAASAAATGSGSGINDELKQETGGLNAGGHNAIKEENSVSSGTSSSAGNEAGTAANIKEESSGCNIKGILKLFLNKQFLNSNCYTVEDDLDEDMKDQKDGIKLEKCSPSSNSSCEKKESSSSATPTGNCAGGSPNSATANVKMEKDVKDAQKIKELKIAESEMVRDLKVQLKWVVESVILFISFITTAWHEFFKIFSERSSRLMIKKDPFFIEENIYFKAFYKAMLVVCCGVRGRALASHTDVRGFEPQYGGRLFSLTCWQL